MADPIGDSVDDTVAAVADLAEADEAAAGCALLCAVLAGCRLQGAKLLAKLSFGRPAAKPKRDAAEASGADDWKATVVVTGEGECEEKRHVCCVPSGGEAVVVIELKHCPKGRPLLPDRYGGWRSQTPDEERSFLLSRYLEQLVGPQFGLLDAVGGRPLPGRYQCAVAAQKWPELFEQLQKPWQDQRTQYYQVKGGTRAPDLFFGVEPKAGSEAEARHHAKPPEPEPPESEGTRAPTESSDDGQGVPLAWCSAWQGVELPTHGTFVHFAQTCERRQRARSAPPG